MKKEETLPKFILTRGLCLCALLLLATIALVLRAGQGGVGAARLLEYADVFQLAALVAFGCALLGSLLMEDVLTYYGE